MKKSAFTLLYICISLFIFVGCSRQMSYAAYEKLITDLEKMGYTVKTEDVEKSILAGERKWLTLNGSDNISVYLYKNPEKMEKDASYISKEGFSYNTGRKAVEIEWISYPHFYKSDNMIVLYVGEDTGIIQALEKLLGQPFAGGIK